MDKFIDILRAIRDTLYPEIVTKHAEVMAVATNNAIIGKSAYEIAVANGFIGTEIEWIASLEGAVGTTGAAGTNGVSITSIVRTIGTGAPGETDTYTITFSNAATSTFTVYNGANGTGTGDMLASNNLSDLINLVTARTNLGVYSKAETDTNISSAVSTLVNASPATLDTLNELATALGNDPAFATTITTLIGTKANQATTYTKTEIDTALGLKADDTDLANYLLLTGGDLTGAVTMKYVAVSANDIVVSSANFFSKTISGTTTLTVSSIPVSPKVSVFILELTNGGSAVVTWWSGIKWDGGTVPTLTVSGLDILVFYTRDGGTTWRGTIRKDSK